MTIHSSHLFGVSLCMLILALLELVLARQVLVTTATRDFNFGPPFLIILAVFQVIVAMVGIAMSLKRSTNE